MTPAFTTDQLLLIPYTASMVTDQHVGWLNDADVVRYSEQRHKKHTLESQHEYLNKFPVGDHIWLIRPMTWVDIGTITAHVDIHNRVANMGILIGEKDKWGKGYGTEAWNAVMFWLFSTGIRKVEAGMMEINMSMRKLCVKAGMRWDGYINDHFIDSYGDTRDAVLYGKLA